MPDRVTRHQVPDHIDILATQILDRNPILHVGVVNTLELFVFRRTLEKLGKYLRQALDATEVSEELLVLVAIARTLGEAGIGCDFIELYILL